MPGLAGGIPWFEFASWRRPSARTGPSTSHLADPEARQAGKTSIAAGRGRWSGLNPFAPGCCRAFSSPSWC